MIINTGKNLQPATAGVTTNTKDAEAKAAAPKTQATGDSVTLSSAATQATNASSEAGAVDKSRVADLKQAIADGSYAINADSIAQKMMAQDKLF